MHDPDLYTAGMGEFQPIGHKIEQDLPDLAVVADEGANIALGLQASPNVFSLRLACHEI